jgi:hypothetical protein
VKQNYRHIPVDVEAMQLTKENAEEVAAWCGGVVKKEINPNDPEDTYVCVDFPTMDGVKRVQENGYLMRSKAGHFTRHTQGFFEHMFKPHDVPARPVLGHEHIPGARKI